MKNSSFLNGLSSKIKIFKCVIWKNSDPNINEDILKTILHYRNRSHGENKSFIMKLPDGLDFESKVSDDNFAKNQENNLNVNNSLNINVPIKHSKSIVNLYKKSYYYK